VVLSLTPNYAGDSFFGISLSVAYGVLAVGSNSSNTCRVYFYSNTTQSPDNTVSKSGKNSSGNSKSISGGVITIIVIVIVGGVVIISYSTYKYMHRSDGISTTLTAGGTISTVLSTDSASSLTGIQRIVKLIKNICCNTESTNKRMKSIQDEKREKAIDSSELN